MIDVLAVVNDHLQNHLGLNYEFGSMSESPPKYPYWVGEYSEPEGLTEDGKEEPTVFVTGFSRGTHMELESQKAKIKDHFKHGVSVITESGALVVIFYGGSTPIPLEDGDLKKCQVNLTIKTWKGK